MSYRIGTGYDVHKLGEGYDLTLGGIVVPSEKGSIGHSDGDTLIHAIIDAMLGALALGDIGTHFPDTDAKYKGIDSKILLSDTSKLILEAGYHIENIDSTICLQEPRLKDHIPLMRSTIAGVLGIDDDRVSVKATTTEKLGFVGLGEGVSARAVVMLAKK